SKEQVQEMVKILLNLPQVPQPSDAADALAVALCHLQQSRLARFMSQKKTS
ncbi:MAG: crossover junction endodeoxyribonuclease RuvC, partial [Dehalococcoidia bacterium]|nr:crossover junction endodeoxyribonuclease RuvC [Dehalococcoidia bacterium]